MPLLGKSVSGSAIVGRSKRKCSNCGRTFSTRHFIFLVNTVNAIATCNGVLQDDEKNLVPEIEKDGIWGEVLKIVNGLLGRLGIYCKTKITTHVKISIQL